MARSSASAYAQGQPALNPLGVQFFSSLEGLEIATPSFFDDDAGEHKEVLRSIDGIDVPLSMHFFDVQLHPYQLHFRRKIVDGEKSAVGTWEDLYGKLAQVRGHLCFQPYVAQQSSFPNIAPRTSFHGPIDTTTIRFKAGGLSTYQLKCCRFRSRIEWMKNMAEGGFVSKKWMYGRGSIIGVLNDALLEEKLPAGQDILVVLVDEFGFTSRASFDVGSSSGMGISPRKAGAAARNPFSHSPIGSPRKQPTKPASPSVAPARIGKGTAVEDESPESATLFSSPANLGSPSMAGSEAERQEAPHEALLIAFT
ncbi:hypothetical protein F5Y01DRAFT_309166 [Xylaria sp. FL0043]|nr:hypothetical protein F5Y01DRAFT_309166 [Xylaria sp. FL0043]